jgi:Protein of unknown function (DUF3445)
MPLPGRFTTGLRKVNRCRATVARGNAAIRGYLWGTRSSRGSLTRNIGPHTGAGFCFAGAIAQWTDRRWRCCLLPSSWALPEKIGRTLHETHAPVPDLNPQLGERIRTALDRLPLGAAWERENWGLSRSCERDQHPDRILRRLDETVEPDELWLRVERQVLYRLPQTGGILFGIRVEIIPWHEIVQSEGARAGLRRSLETMPAEIASYKGLSTARAISSTAKLRPTTAMLPLSK